MAETSKQLKECWTSAEVSPLGKTEVPSGCKYNCLENLFSMVQTQWWLIFILTHVLPLVEPFFLSGLM